MEAEAGASTSVHARPYAPGFADRILGSRWFASRAGWLVYVAVTIAVTVVYWIVASYEGTLPTRTTAMHLVLPALAFAGLPALAWFNAIARRSLAAARPLIKADATGYDLLTYRLTTMPGWLAIAAAVLGLLAFAGLTAFQPAETYETLQIMVTPMATVFEWMLQFLTWVGVGVSAVEIARKLWVIDDIYRNHMQIDVLRPVALTAFSRLAAAMVILTMGAVVVGTIALGKLAATGLWLVGGGLPTLLAAVAFVAPLWGGHRLIVRERARHLDALGERIRTTIAALRSRVDADQQDDIEPLKTTLEALMAVREEYRSVSTWPWQPSTLGSVVTALIAPTAVWFITRWLEGARIP